MQWKWNGNTDLGVWKVANDTTDAYDGTGFKSEALSEGLYKLRVHLFCVKYNILIGKSNSTMAKVRIFLILYIHIIIRNHAVVKLD